MIIAAILCQIALLAYHQATTLIDLHPFNGVRHANRHERLIEAAVNAVLMSLAPIDGSFAQRGTSPQRISLSTRSPCEFCRTIGTGCIGAML